MARKLVLLSLFVALGNSSASAQRLPVSPLELKGRYAPDFDLVVLDGKMFDGSDQTRSLAPKHVRLSEQRGNVVVVNFFATWCTPCKAEHPVLLEMRRKYAHAGVEVFTILIEDTPKNARRYLAEGYTGLPILVGTDTDVAKLYGVGRGVPVTFFVDRSGVVRRVVMGGMVSQFKASMSVDSLLRGMRGPFPEHP